MAGPCNVNYVALLVGVSMESNIEDVFKKLSLHMLEGVMIHEEMANYFAFLGLNGYEATQANRYIEESNNLSKLHSFYIRYFGKLIPRVQISTIPQIIPDSFYNHVTNDLSTNDIRQSVKTIFEYWASWEEKTKSLFEQSYIGLRDSYNEVSSSIVVMELLKDVNVELEMVKNKLHKLRSTNFDIVYIVEDQDKND